MNIKSAIEANDAAEKVWADAREAIEPAAQRWYAKTGTLKQLREAIKAERDAFAAYQKAGVDDNTGHMPGCMCQPCCDYRRSQES